MGEKVQPTNTKFQPNVDFMSGQCRRRWTNNKPALVLRIVFAGHSLALKLKKYFAMFGRNIIFVI